MFNLTQLALEGARLNAMMIAALELRLSEHLGVEGATIAQLAERACVSVRGAQAVADAMVTLRLWHVHAGVYRLAKSAVEQLLPTGSAYVGDGHAELYRCWLPTYARITEIVRSGEPGFEADSPALMDFWARLTPVLAHGSQTVAARAIECFGLHTGAVRLLDVGGGARALYANALLSANPQARATQLDWPAINASAAEYVRAQGHGARFETLDGDYRTQTLPAGQFDVAVLSNIVHLEGPKCVYALLQRLRRALASQGRLILCDWIVEDDRTGPSAALLFNSTMLMLTGEGRAYTRSELSGLLHEAGFAELTFVPINPSATLLSGVVARKGNHGADCNSGNRL